MADLTTTAAVKAFAGVTGSGDDSAIGGIVSAVSAVLHEIIGHTYDATPIVAELHPKPPTQYLVVRRPIASVSAVREAGETLAASSYRLPGAGSRLLERRAGGGSVVWLGEVEVDYTPTATVPANVELAAREAAAWVVKESALAAGASRLGLTAQANPDSGNADYFVRSIGDLPLVRELMRSHRRLV